LQIREILMLFRQKLYLKTDAIEYANFEKCALKKKHVAIVYD